MGKPEGLASKSQYSLNSGPYCRFLVPIHYKTCINVL